MTKDDLLKLHSPVGSVPITLKWRDGVCRGTDVVETIRWVIQDLPDLKCVIERNILNDVDVDDLENMRSVCDRFNKTIDKLVRLEKGTSIPMKRLNKYPCNGLLKHILQQAYNEAVIDPDKLNRYEPFSPEVYGETSYEMVDQILQQIEIKEDDVFVDLGSGVGQIVMQVSAATPCLNCFGIEKAEVPSRYAEMMDTHFRAWMDWYGKKYNEYELIKGDFLEEQFRDKLMSATIVFCNNFAFGPQVDHGLKLIFADLKDGAKIISSKSFCPLNFRITDRNLSDIGTIMRLREFASMQGSVSWTDKSVAYFLHVIDRAKLENYFRRNKNPCLEDDSDVKFFEQPRFRKLVTFIAKNKNDKRGKGGKNLRSFRSSKSNEKLRDDDDLKRDTKKNKSLKSLIKIEPDFDYKDERNVEKMVKITQKFEELPKIISNSFEADLRLINCRNEKTHVKKSDESRRKQRRLSTKDTKPMKLSSSKIPDAQLADLIDPTKTPPALIRLLLKIREKYLVAMKALAEPNSVTKLEKMLSNERAKQKQLKKTVKRTTVEVRQLTTSLQNWIVEQVTKLGLTLDSDYAKAGDEFVSENIKLLKMNKQISREIRMLEEENSRLQHLRDQEARAAGLDTKLSPKSPHVFNDDRLARPNPIEYSSQGSSNLHDFNYPVCVKTDPDQTSEPSPRPSNSEEDTGYESTNVNTEEDLSESTETLSAGDVKSETSEPGDVDAIKIKREITCPKMDLTRIYEKFTELTGPSKIGRIIPSGPARSVNNLLPFVTSIKTEKEDLGPWTNRTENDIRDVFNSYTNNNYKINGKISKQETVVIPANECRNGQYGRESTMTTIKTEANNVVVLDDRASYSEFYQKNCGPVENVKQMNENGRAFPLKRSREEKSTRKSGKMAKVDVKNRVAMPQFPDLAETIQKTLFGNIAGINSKSLSNSPANGSIASSTKALNNMNAFYRYQTLPTSSTQQKVASTLTPALTSKYMSGLNSLNNPVSSLNNMNNSVNSLNMSAASNAFNMNSLSDLNSVNADGIVTISKQSLINAAISNMLNQS